MSPPSLSFTDAWWAEEAAKAEQEAGTAEKEGGKAEKGGHALGGGEGGAGRTLSASEQLCLTQKAEALRALTPGIKALRLD
jgi:hypothetical protein